MSAKTTRSKRTRASESPVAEEPDVDDEQPRRRRSRSKGQAAEAPTPAAEESEQAGDGARQEAGAQPPPRFRLQRVQFSQQEATQMTEAIKALEEAAADARDKAEDLGVPQTAVDGLTAKVVRFMLFKGYDKPDVPVKRQELVDLVQKDQHGGRFAKKLPGLVLPLAAAQLASVFGLEMKELARPAGPAAAAAARKPAAAAAGSEAAPAAAAAAAGGSATQTFVLRSLLPSALHTHFVQDRLDDCARGLTTVVLGLLQLNGGSMEAEELWRHLSQLGVQQEETHNMFGRHGAQEVLGNMERARYLVSRRETNPVQGGVTITFSWGERATEEFGGQQLKQFVDQVLAAGGRAQEDAEDAEAGINS